MKNMKLLPQLGTMTFLKWHNSINIRQINKNIGSSEMSDNSHSDKPLNIAIA